MFVAVVNFISDAHKLHTSQYCKGAENDAFGRVVVEPQKNFNECMKKCLELNPPAHLFTVNRPYVCNRANKPKPCKCWCHTQPNAAGGCTGRDKGAFDVYKILYKGTLCLN